MKKIFLLLAVAFVAAINCFANIQFSFDVVGKPINHSEIEIPTVRGKNLDDFTGSINKLLEFGFEAGIVYFVEKENSETGKMLFSLLDEDSAESQQENQTDSSKYQCGIYFDVEMLSYRNAIIKIKKDDKTKKTFNDKVNGGDYSLALGFCGRYNKSESFFFDFKLGLYGSYTSFENKDDSYNLMSLAGGCELGISINYRILKTSKFATALSLGCEINAGSCFGTLSESGYDDTTFDLSSKSTEIGIEVHTGVKFIL
ncbi:MULTISPECIES: hypothetical protein [unclassified Treponema]|uniref:hypothetical protein n=1 Tax=unclassified Treponema TaxID=2638727 RepID=UPI0025D9E227|nr:MULTISPECIES: hypothetical protein [unclassified Treponema]